MILYNLVSALVKVLELAIFARVLLSWVSVSRDNRLVSIILEITEPILGPIRRVVPPLGGLDLSPMIALILIEMAQRVVLTILARVV